MRAVKTLGVALLLFTTVLSAGSPLSGLWKDFRAAAKAAHYDEPVRLYGVDDAGTVLCYIYKDQVFLFRGGTITKPTYAKMFSARGINRIHHRTGPDGTGGHFELWSDDELVLSLGA